MKIKMFSGAVTGLLLAGIPLVGGCKDDAPPTLAQVAPATAGVQPVARVEAVPPAPLAAADDAVVARPVPAQPSGEQPLPSDIQLSANAAQVVKLAQAGVDEPVMLSFVKNSAGAFNLGSEEIIYLKDVGVESSVITAMIERDRAFGVAQAVAPVAPVAQQPEQPVSVNSFNAALSPYGSWVEIEGYGRCWQPTVVVSTPTWQPYCDRGHWVYTDCGWYWYSDYSWGYTTFHYGRWFRHGRFGWCWSPDTVWGPAWVTWRTSSDYCGWAPLPPHAVFVSGGGFTYYGRSVDIGFDFGLSVSCYSFLPFGRLCDPFPRNHVVVQKNVTKIYNNTTIINNYGSGNNNTVINHGVPVERVSAASHTTIKPVSIRETPSAFHQTSERLERHGKEAVLYRPTTSSAFTRSEPSRRTETQTSTPAKAVLPRTNPGEERRRTETAKQPPTTTPTRPTTTPGNTPPSTGSRENTPRRAVQPRTSTTVQQNEIAPGSTTTGTSPLIIGGRNRERPTVSTGVSAPTVTPPTTPRNPSAFYTTPRFESPRVQAEASRPAVQSPQPSSPASTRVERQELSRPAPVVSHRDSENSNPSAFRARPTTSGDQGATQSSRSEISSRSQSRSDSRSEKKSKD